MKKLILLFTVFSMLLFLGCTKYNELPENAGEEILEDVLTQDEDAGSTSDTEEPLPPVTEETDVSVEAEVKDMPEEHTAEATGVNEIKLSTYSVALHIGEKKMPLVTMLPEDATDKREVWTSNDESVASVDGLGNIKGVSEGECVITVTSVNNRSVSASVNVTVLPEAECTYIEGILVVNKTYPLPPSYAPGWDTEASGPLWEMIAAAEKDGIKLWMTSGYRSYYDQQYIYNNYVKRDGQEKADTYSARPGHSEHQTGLAYDLNDLTWDFGETPEGIWVAENCHKYGFILRYPKDKEEITGYVYEPWHIRYVGVEKAGEIYESGICLEEYLNITSVYADK